MNEKQTCARRMTEMGPWEYAEGLDEWRSDRWLADREEAERAKAEYEAKYPGSLAALTDWRWPGGVPRTCSFCGGIHPEDAIRLVSEGWEAGGTTKGYKAYLEPPGTMTRHEAFLASIRDHGREPGEGVPSVWSPSPPVKVYFQHFSRGQVDRFHEARRASRHS